MTTGRIRQARLVPGSARNVQLGQRIAARIQRLGADQEYEQVRLLDRLPVAVEFLGRRQISAVEEHTVPLRPKGQVEPFDELPILGRIAQKDAHRPYESRTRRSCRTRSGRGDYDTRRRRVAKSSE